MGINSGFKWLIKLARFSALDNIHALVTV